MPMKFHSNVRGEVQLNCSDPFCLENPHFHVWFRKLEKAVAVRNSLLEKFSGKFRRCWKMIPRFSGSTKCYPCQGLRIFRQEKWPLEDWPRLRERSWIFSSETATAFLSSSEWRPKGSRIVRANVECSFELSPFQVFFWSLISQEPLNAPFCFAGVLRGNTIRGNTTRNSERKMAL